MPALIAAPATCRRTRCTREAAEALEAAAMACDSLHDITADESLRKLLSDALRACDRAASRMGEVQQG